MAAFSKVRNEDGTWNVLDNRFKKAIKFNLKAAKADAWVTIKNKQVAEADAVWAKLES